MNNNNNERRGPRRPEFPKRAIVTAGMPYGNKELHFGHVGGMMVHADTYARFLRDRIGKDNVVFVSGTDCYGSPIIASHKKLVDEEGYTGTVKDFVMSNHNKQKEVLKQYEINFNLYAASAFNEAGEVHQAYSNELFNILYEAGYLEKLSTPQFFDPVHKVLLNGRQVVGKCPLDGCQSEKAYADECDLGHQYMPNELIDPISTLSGEKPELVEVENWYFKLEEYQQALTAYAEYIKRNTNTRKYQVKTVEEFLKSPMIYVQRKQIEDIDAVVAKLPKHELMDEPKKPSYTFIFDNLKDRDGARAALEEMGIFFRTGKTLVPFRLTGNVEWGVKVPEVEGAKDLTFWVWPESLWAPISFSKTYLASIGKDDDEWQKYWHDEEAKVYQFIGEDNIYFYGVAEMGMFLALKGYKGDDEVDFEKVNLPHLVANNHILYMNKKASSSGTLKPPMARELLEHYTSDQLRMHFLSLGLAKKSVSFMPQAFMSEEEKEGQDTVLKDGNLLTNVFNRLLRSCFYTAQKYFDSKIPDMNREVSDKVINDVKKVVLNYEKHMYNHDFHLVTYDLDSIIRTMSKYWSNNMKKAENDENTELMAQILVDSIYAVRVILTLLHPITPASCENARDYFKFNDNIWNWKYIFEGIGTFIDDEDNHSLKFLEPRVDFFTKHESQFRR